MKILVTGGAGYIGSHTCLELINAGHDVIVIDNLQNSKREPLKRVSELTNRELLFFEIDIQDKDNLSDVFKQFKPEAVIHFAGLKAVGESVSNPLRYYQNNVSGSINLFRVMHEAGIKNLIFSSSATVYGLPMEVPIIEETPPSPVNPYGHSKLMIERILLDLHSADKEWSIVLLRYFNPVGAHPSGRIGEDPNGIPNNLFPYISQVAVGKLPMLMVYGNDYHTPDGTGIRDYIHVVDLAKAHVKALDILKDNLGASIYNLGTGRGYSVLEVIETFEETNGTSIPYKIVGRREGDVAVSYADVKKANRHLMWSAEKGLTEMCADTWRWQSQNPNGYNDLS
jgi:UDP-glucose 4-epimerase